MPEPLAGEVLVKSTACGVCHTDLHVMKAEVAFPTPCGARPRDLRRRRGPRPRRRGPGRRARPSSRRSSCRADFCSACGAGRDDLCEQLLRHEPAAAARSTTARRGCAGPTAGRSRCTRGRAWPSIPSFPPPTSSRSRRTCRCPSRRSSAARCSRRTAPSATPPTCVAGERIAVVAAGGVGLNIIQIAKAFGASQIIAIDVRDDKLEMARQLGATDTINAASGDVDRAGQGADRRPRRGRRLRGARTARDLRPGVRHHSRRRAHGGRRHRRRPHDRARGDHAPRPPWPSHRRLVRRAHASRHARDHPPGRASASFAPSRWSRSRFSLDQADVAYQALSRGEIVGRAIVVP